MKIELQIDEECKETRVVITANKISDEVDQLIKKLAEKRPFDILLGFYEGSAEVVHPEKIIRIYSANQKVFAVTQNKELVIRKRLYELEEILKEPDFVRISNSEIINLKQVKGFDLRLSGTICVKFLNGAVSYVSRRYVARIKQLLGL